MISREQQAALWLADCELFEACEPRLVFSAQPLLDTTVESPFIYPQLAEAHVVTGNDWVQAEYGLTGAGQTVAIIDSGVAWDHAALGQGFGPGYRVVGGWDFAEDDSNPYDDGPAGFHGTHVSGIVGGDHGDAPGVARDVDLVSLRVFDDSGAGNLEWVESALQWVHEHRNAFENPITAVNLSVGTLWNGEEQPDWSSLEDEFRQLHEAGIVLTAAAGNEFASQPGEGLIYPASSQYVTAVASQDSDGTLSSFSQRVDGILSAPGSAIRSAVPDHLLGRDGQVDDFLGSSGTSMSAPYVVGASVLVRQAMEMAGWESIDSDTIMSHLRSTADTLWDPITQSEYLGVNLQVAIQSLLPVDSVGDSSADATILANAWQDTQTTWVNSISDQDVYRFTPEVSGEWSVRVSSDWVDGLSWSLRSDQRTLADGNESNPVSNTIELQAGQPYELWVSADTVGPVSIEGQWTPGLEETKPQGSDAFLLGRALYLEREATDGESFSFVASQDGIFTAHWELQPSDTQGVNGSLRLFRQGDEALELIANTSHWEDGVLRLDVPVLEGEQILVQLPESPMLIRGELVLADRMQLSQEGALVVSGTAGQDSIGLDLSDQENAIEVEFGKLQYSFDPQSIQEIVLQGYANADRLEITGSSQIDKVELRPDYAMFDNSDVSVRARDFESIEYQSGGGADRVYMYDSDGDDTLSAFPHYAELKGAGYEYSVSGLSRIFIHATGAGDDYAYLYDSSGNDSLSMRPQFTSLSGEGFFNYVRGFERVYAYGTAGGEDLAKLYDSAGNDRFSTSGASVSLTGPGFASFARGFDEVTAYADAGGDDLATLYGSPEANWNTAAGSIQMDQELWTRQVRGFESVETFESGAAVEVFTQSVTLHASQAQEQIEGWTNGTGDAVLHLEPEEGIDPLYLPELDLLEDPVLEGNILDKTFSDLEDLLDEV